MRGHVRRGESKPVILQRADIESLRRSGTVIESDLRGPKVVLLADGRYLKLFRRRRLLSRELLLPAVTRFARHAARLARLGVPTLRVMALHCDRWRGFGAAVYDPLPGDTFRRLLVEDRVDVALMRDLGAFIATLHHRGLYFRSLHPGNIVYDGKSFGLIDVLDLQFRPCPLNRWERRRNWQHFLRVAGDRRQLVGERLDALRAGYAGAARLPEGAIRVALRDLHES